MVRIDRSVRVRRLATAAVAMNLLRKVACPSGIYYPAGNAICQLVIDRASKDEIACSAKATRGSAYNLMAVREGDLEFGITRSEREYEALRGMEGFTETGPFAELRIDFSLHAESLTIVVRRHAGIRSLDDLTGRNIDAGDKWSTAHKLLLDLPGAHDLDGNALSLNHSIQHARRALEFCGGGTDALIVAEAHPSTRVTEASNLCDVQFLEVSPADIVRLLANNRALRKSRIPRGLYRGLNEDIKTFGYGAVVVTSTAVDNWIVKLLAQSVFDDLEAFKRLHPVFARLDPNVMISEGMSSPLHDGVLHYPRETRQP